MLPVAIYYVGLPKEFCNISGQINAFTSYSRTHLGTHMFSDAAAVQEEEFCQFNCSLGVIVRSRGNLNLSRSLKQDFPGSRHCR